MGRIKTITALDGMVEGIRDYDSLGRLLSAKDGMGSGISLSYDFGGRRTQSATFGGARQCYTYDAYGNITGIEDGNGNKTQYILDEWGRITKIKKADESEESYTYDYAGNITSTTDGEGNKTSYTYNNINKLAERTDALGEVETYLYDAATGSKKMDGYYPKLMEEIYEWERDEVEDIVWNGFYKKNDIDMAIFLPKLRKYHGIEKLKEVLLKSKIPSDCSVTLSQVLYESTGDIKYLEIIKQNIDMEPDKISNVAILSYCKPCKKTYDLLVDIYVNSKNEVIRSTAVTGILYNKKIIKNPLDLQEMMMNLDLERKFDSDDISERRKIIKKLENGQL